MPPESPPLGLRERKKAKTRATIQRQALRLFREQGYDETTVAQIAEQVEISPSTFFRYFPTKEDVVLYDPFDPVIFATFEAQPADLEPITALRRAIEGAYAGLGMEEMAEQRERAELCLAVPELRMRMLEHTLLATRDLAGMLAKRVRRAADDPELLTYTGAVIGGLLAATLAAIAEGHDLFEAIDASLAFLSGRLRL
ncbi:MAG: TetR family transcriptional regulator [Chloroflexi bacterium]|nr:TetR family transcriptional regulator [Chloroflexota bacterium]